MENKVTDVPYIVHEAEMARMERVNKRLWITVFVCLFIIIATNAGWIWRESQFVDEVTETIETSAEGGGDGSEVNYGQGESNADKAQNP